MALLDLDERIFQLPGSNALEQEGMDDQISEVKQLIIDVLEYVKPSRAPIREDGELTMGYNAGFMVAVDEMEAKQRELGLIE